ncbi:hypothetical protein DFA_03803 [Cavenderia fasciculata]|uniref:Methyltransferase domain-containing protein n=1 Tax=Cavenderia fasciculata TaxID=261658 RepID=F4Q0F8_CACFS|nr:uncharacterized protein DFA_03803 [Cavenderia fasciculata]EGG18309.1 hypothetical protein DFA_03803 [Cavenderia fasciculata]|eukprot:XP_004357132.1 hypothetical protein DFA_03803 [Cavenderia fasciculata]
MNDLIKSYLGGGEGKQVYEWNPPESFKDKTPQEYSRHLAVFIKKYQWLTSARTIDFFIDDLWQLVPEDWRDDLLELTDEESIQFTTGNVIKENWNESLKEFINDAKRLWMPRDVLREDKDWNVKDFSLPSLKLKMNAKKLHEILRMSELLDDCIKSIQPSQVVDIGSGEGYLTQVLSHQFNQSITAVDCSQSFIQGAIKRQNVIENELVGRLIQEKNKTSKVSKQTNQINQINQNNNNVNLNQMDKEKKEDGKEKDGIPKKIKKKLTKEEQDLIVEQKRKERLEKRQEIMNEIGVSGPQMCVATLRPEMTTEEFLEILTRHDQSKDYSNTMLVGLHTCGSLASTMITNYVRCDNISSIVDVGCCYYRVTQHPYQYMSKQCGDLGVVMGAADLKLSCESSERSYSISQNGLDEYRYSMDVHFYRVIFETLLGKNHNYTIRSIPRNHSQNFQSYSLYALKRINNQSKQEEEKEKEDTTSTTSTTNIVPPSIEELNDTYERFKKDKNKISILLLLRGLLAPVLEAFIVIDRWLYLEETKQQSTRPMSSYIIPIFHESLSPRNLVLLSIKQ